MVVSQLSPKSSDDARTTNSPSRAAKASSPSSKPGSPARAKATTVTSNPIRRRSPSPTSPRGSTEKAAKSSDSSPKRKTADSSGSDGPDKKAKINANATVGGSDGNPVTAVTTFSRLLNNMKKDTTAFQGACEKAMHKVSVDASRNRKLLEEHADPAATIGAVAMTESLRDLELQIEVRMEIHNDD